MSRTRLSAHFYADEFACHDGTPVPDAALPALSELCLHMLEPLRDKYGPCKVTSGYRHRAYNIRIGGAESSQHIYDLDPRSVAADVTFQKGTPAQWARSARWRFRVKKRWNGMADLERFRRLGKRGGVGYYPAQGFVHLDSGPRRDWSG